MKILGPLMVARMAIRAGTLLIVIGGLRASIHLTDVLILLDRTAPKMRETYPERRGLEAAGERLHNTLRLLIICNQQWLLLLSGRGVASSFTEKPVLATTGLLAPAI